MTTDEKRALRRELRGAREAIPGGERASRAKQAARVTSLPFASVETHKVSPGGFRKGK